MYEQPYYMPYMNYYYPQPAYYVPNESYQEEDRQQEGAPTSPPPSQIPPAQTAAFAGPVQTGQVRSRLCACLGNWGLLGLRTQGPFGKDFWFYPSEIRAESVTGYTWQSGRARRVRYRYSQIRNFMCFV
ncbi:hypothetical protein LC040_03295 [Bacillus tianshenii]|nr:hypothetical protein LC040_03295 [Bacillus tianshenii]